MSDYPMLISNKLHSFRNFLLQSYTIRKKNSMLAKLIRRIKCCSVQEILMIVSIIMLLIVIANRTSAGIKARSASSGQITQHQKQAAPPQE